jgi:hypothetical protein
VPDKIDSTSVKFRSLTDESTSVIEQTYRYDMVSLQALLKQNLDKELTVTVVEGDKTRQVTGQLLSYANGVMLKTDDGIESYNEIAGVKLPSTEGLITKPTLIWLVQAGSDGVHNTETSYMTSGMTWRADYVAVVNAEDSALDLKGWTTINNTSGKTYNNSTLQLVAGDVNRVQQQNRARAYAPMAEYSMGDTGGGGFAEESLFEYHLYTLGRRTNVGDKQQKQIELLSSNGVSANKVLQYDWTKSNEKVRTILKLKNDEESGLGMPLPAGIVRAFKSDSTGQLQFIGEDRIDHTPKKKEFDIFLGFAFDVTAERTVQERKNIPQIIGSRGEEQEVEVKLLNSKEEPVDVTIVERIWGKEAEITGVKARKIDANQFEIDVTIPPGKEITITYKTKRIY